MSEILDQAYHQNGNWPGEDYVTGMEHFQVTAVEQVATQALIEVRGWRDPFHLAMPPGTTDDQWHGDEQLVLLGDGDTAGSAAMAASCSSEPFISDLERLLAFWTWWLDTARPRAEVYGGMGIDMYGPPDENAAGDEPVGAYGCWDGTSRCGPPALHCYAMNKNDRVKNPYETVTRYNAAGPKPLKSHRKDEWRPQKESLFKEFSIFIFMALLTLVLFGLMIYGAGK